MLSNDQELDKKIEEWLKWDKNEKTITEVKLLIEQQNWKTLSQRLLKRLSFGTAGLRGCMRAGFDSVNDLVIIQTAQGLCEYVLSQFPLNEHKDNGIVLGYDGRYGSKRYAQLTASIFLNRGVRVYLFRSVVPTPYVPFAIMRYKCLAGVMVTASHNPKEDNGYKVYWTNGAQIIQPHDHGIQSAILENLEPLESSWNIDAAMQTYSQLVSDPYDDIIDAYNTQLARNLPKQFIETNTKSNLQFVYTAMHGVGYSFIEKSFEVAGLNPVVAVVEQQYPDPDFPTVRFPNPEEGKSSLELSIATAERENISIILANDPDADRLACAEKVGDVWKVFTGNELGALLGWWALQNYLEFHPEAEELNNCYMIASTVSSKFLRTMAKKEGFQFAETLTGFKWMANMAIDLIANKKTVLFAFEEAIGFMFSTVVLDKDGVSAACHLATLANHLHTMNKTLDIKLHELYEEYGYHCANVSYLFCYDPKVIQRIFERLRHYSIEQEKHGNFTYPQSILNGEFKIKYVRDLTTGVDTSMPDGRATLPVCSNSQMITFTFENGLVITLRTSGTEPKIKYYAELCASPNEKDWDLLQKLLARMVDAIIEEFLQPSHNNLVAKED